MTMADFSFVRLYVDDPDGFGHIFVALDPDGDRRRAFAPVQP